MEKPSDIQIKNPRPIKPLVKDTGTEYNKEVQNVVVIRNLLNAIVKVTGAVTGKQYIFAGAGTTQNVDIKDANEVLNKKRGKSVVALPQIGFCLN